MACLFGVPRHASTHKGNPQNSVRRGSWEYRLLCKMFLVQAIDYISIETTHHKAAGSIKIASRQQGAQEAIEKLRRLGHFNDQISKIAVKVKPS